eukprot:jgi/Picre1/27363/NNA_000330.t1
MGRNDRPEETAPPEIFYNDTEARKYTDNSRIIKIQTALTERALELLALPEDGTPKLLLDLGCGSGLSGEALSEEGHIWVGTDISPHMLEVATEKEVQGDLCLHDLGHGVPFRMGTFDGAISISAVQWLCNADTSAHDPRKRLRRFFETLYASLAKGARAVLQIYPKNTEQASMITNAAMRVGFSGGLVVDFPHSTRAKKYFLVLMVGVQPLSLRVKWKVMTCMMTMMLLRTSVKVHDRRTRRRKGDKVKGKAWVLRKKEQQRYRGQADVRPDSKYTGRKRKDRF